VTGAGQSKTVKIIGVSCSPRKDRTTAAALRVCLEAAKAAGPEIEVELIDLGGMKIKTGAGIPLPRRTDNSVEAKLRAPNVAASSSGRRSLQQHELTLQGVPGSLDGIPGTSLCVTRSAGGDG
jgi:hypothetical protein